MLLQLYSRSLILSTALNNKRQRDSAVADEQHTLHRRLKYLQLDSIMRTVLRYSPVKITVTLKPGLEGIQGHGTILQDHI